MTGKLGSLKAVHVTIGGLPAGCLMPGAAIRLICDHFDTDRNGAIEALRLRCSRLDVVAFAGGFVGFIPSEVRNETDARKGAGAIPVWSGFWKSDAVKDPANSIWGTGDAEHYWPDGQRINYSDVGFRESDILRMIGLPIPIVCQPVPDSITQTLPLPQSFNVPAGVTLKGGRPNRTDEGLAIHDDRLKRGISLGPSKEEWKIIAAMLDAKYPGEAPYLKAGTLRDAYSRRRRKAV